MPPELAGTEFLRQVWEHQAMYRKDLSSFHVTLMWKSPTGKMNHTAFPLKDVLSRDLELLPTGKGDWYWCPNLFDQPKRRMTYCDGGAVLYQDLDEVAPASCSLPPSFYWETSPGRYQAVWLLDKWLKLDSLMRLNKALNREVRADKGTWNVTRLLRVPGTWSEKRKAFVSDAYEYHNTSRAASGA